MTHEHTALHEWLALADEVARRHRQGQVLATDPALVLRGLPPLWRPAGGSGDGGPGDDVVSLAGAALDRIRPDDDVRLALVEAAAGCLGSDLPALLRRIRPLVEEHADRDGEASPSPAPGAGEAAGAPPERPGRRVALAGGLAVAVLAVLGIVDTWPAPDPEVGTALSARPTPLGGDDAALVSWEPPHLTVEVGPTRYRYRLEGDVEGVALHSDGGRPTLVATVDDQRWQLAVPALDATGPDPAGSG